MSETSTPNDADELLQCQAIARRSGERCQRTALGKYPYCVEHIHLYDPDVDDGPM